MNEGTPATHLDSAALTQLCLQQIEREEAGLAGTLQVLRQVREALVSGDQAALANALQQQELLAQAANELQLARDQFRQTIAASLGISVDAVTLQALAEHLPGPVQDALIAGRDRLRALAEEVEKINSGNASLTYYCLEFLQRFFLRITGGQSSGRYGPAGTLQKTSCGSIIEGRG